MTWRHTRQSQDPIPECRDCWDEHIEDICCEPTPDPASPCGYAFPSGVRCGYDAARHGMWRNPTHPHVPTRCLSCGHAIEEAR
jgi:hypothetical protein